MDTKNYKIIIRFTALYAIFTTICLYKNISGITMPLFMLSTLLYFVYCFKIFEISLRPMAKFYSVSLSLLGISNFITDDPAILFFNYIGIVILLMSFLLHHFYQEKDWDIVKYIVMFGYVLFGSLEYIASPVLDYINGKKTKSENKNVTVNSIVIGALIAIPMLIFILVLLNSADVVFSHILSSIFKGLIMPTNIIGVTVMTIVVFFYTYALVVKLSKTKEITLKEVEKKESLIAITFNAVLFCVYFLFCLIQFIYLFTGSLSLPEGYTYAQYAREGFFQLLFISVFNMIIVIFSLKKFKQHKILNGLLLSISICTYILIASSALRMSMYIESYGLTFLRIFVLWSLLVIAFLMIGVIIKIYRPLFKLFNFQIIIVASLYILLSFSHPDYWIATYNLKSTPLNNSYHPYKVDKVFLSGLSSDAALAMEKYYQNNQDEKWIEQYFNGIKQKYDHNILKFNVSRYIAVELGNKIRN